MLAAAEVCQDRSIRSAHSRGGRERCSGSDETRPDGTRTWSHILDEKGQADVKTRTGLWSPCSALRHAGRKGAGDDGGNVVAVEEPGTIVSAR